MKKILILLLLTACELPLKEKTSSIQNSDLELLQNIENEEYKMITTAVSMLIYVNHHDQTTFKRWGKEKGVKVSVLGPADWDVTAQINTIEEIIGTKPSGLHRPRHCTSY